MRRILTILFILTIIMLNGFTGDKDFLQLPENHGVEVVQFNGTTFTNYEDFTRIDSIIIEFSEEPMFVSEKGHSRAHYQSLFSQFESDLRIIESEIQGQYRNVPPIEIGRSFYKLYCGMSLTVPRLAINQINDLPYVKKVHRNKPVRASLDQSVPFIGADQVWDDYGATGEGVVVGVIDSGVDYTHPALGGGIGPAYKVIGGYNFDHFNDDPMDENGHGTHVAGIIAANSDTLRGVAPDASILAVRVLDEYGSGDQSDVIAGIEFCSDPDGDDDSSDHVDVVNMSLGSTGGTPDDPASEAVNHGSVVGIVFCVAAGNQWNPLSIGSPASARSAVAVGATTLEDSLANFSSEGPNLVDFAIKPEICAPGYRIISSYPGNTVAEMSGTSMAAPHVAGVAALIKQLHPDWNPDQMRSAFINNAVDIGLDIMQQGGGRVDAMAAVDPGILFNPDCLNFEPDTTSYGGEFVVEAEFSINLQVENVSDETAAVSFTTQSPHPALQISLDPSSATLLAGETQDIEVVLTVDNTQLSVDDLEFFTGWVNVDGQDRSWKIPWTITKVSELVLEFDRIPGSLYLFNDDFLFDMFQSTQIDNYRIKFDVPAGEYSSFARIAGSPTRVYYRDGIEADPGYNHYVLSESDGMNEIVLNGRDINGDAIEYGSDTSYLLGFNMRNSRFTYSMSGFNVQTFYTHDIPASDMIYTGVCNWNAQNDFHMVKFDNLYGIMGDMVLVNDPADFRTWDFTIADFGWGDFPVSPAVFSWHGLGDGFYMGVSQNHGHHSVNGVFNGRVMMTGDYTGEHGASISFSLNSENDHFFYALAPVFKLLDDRLSLADNGYISALEPSYPVGEHVYFGHFPLTLVSLCRIKNNEMTLTGTPLCGSGMQYNGGANHLQITVTNETGEILYSGVNGGMELELPSSGYYKAEMRYGDYSLGDVPGNIDVFFQFDNRLEDTTPPYIPMITLVDENGTPQGILESGQRLLARFDVCDVEPNGDTYEYQSVPDENVHFYAREHGTGDWTEFPITFLQEISELSFVFGKAFEADISEMVEADSSMVDIRIVAVDDVGNAVEYQSAPAFGTGDYITGIDEGIAEQDAPKVDRFTGNYPNPFNPETNIMFSLSGVRHVKIDIYNIKGQKVTRLLDDKLPAGAHKITWEGLNEEKKPVSSGVYFIRLQTGQIDTVRKALLLK